MVEVNRKSRLVRGAQDLHHRQEEDQVNGGLQKTAREKQVIERKEAGIGERGHREEPLREMVAGRRPEF